MNTVLGLGIPGGWEWLVVAVIALLLFGKRLPEVARSVGKGIVEFKKGLRDVEDEVTRESNQPPAEGRTEPQSNDPPAK